MSFRSILASVRRWWSTLLVATAVAGATGMLLASTIPPTYESRASVLVGPVSGDVDTVRAAGLLVQTFAELSTSDQVLAAAASDAGALSDASALRQQVRTTGDNATRVLTIRVVLDDPKLAASVATAIAQQLSTLAAADTSRPEGQVQVIHAAAVDPTPVAPRPFLIMGLAALAGLLGSAALVIVLERLSGTVRSQEELADLVSVPVLALPAPRRGRADALVVEADPGSSADTAYRLLSSRLDLDQVTETPTWLHVAGVGDDTSAGLTAANLAGAAAAEGIPVAVIDADGSGVASRILAAGSEGDAASAVRLVRPPLERLAPEARRQSVLGAIEDAGREGRHVIVVGGPMVHDRLDLAWAVAASRTLLVVEKDRSRRRDVQAAVERLERAGAAILAVLAAPPSGADIRRLREGDDAQLAGRLPLMRVLGPITDEDAVPGAPEPRRSPRRPAAPGREVAPETSAQR